MKIPTTLLAQLCTIAVLGAPSVLPAGEIERTAARLGLTRYVVPEYPDAARQDGFATGHVTLAVGSNIRGEPVDVLVLEATHPKMAEAAVKAVRKWRFIPGSKPADLATRTMRIGFKMQGVVVFPFGKNPVTEPWADTTGLAGPLTVPRVQSLDRQPKVLVQPMPAYPAALISRNIEGTAAVRFYVDEEGRVRLPELIEATTPEFAEAALAAVAQWRYEPPEASGRRIVACDYWTFRFEAVN